MNTALLREFHQMRNPAYGSLLLWQLASGYEHSKGESYLMPLGVAFIGLPLLLDGKIRELISSTQQRSGLQRLIAKVNEVAPELRAGLYLNVLHNRDLCRESVAFACYYQLITIRADKVITIRSSSLSASDRRELGSVIINDAKAAEKLGIWFSQLRIEDIKFILNLEF